MKLICLLLIIMVLVIIGISFWSSYIVQRDFPDYHPELYRKGKRKDK